MPEKTCNMYNLNHWYNNCLKTYHEQVPPLGPLWNWKAFMYSIKIFCKSSILVLQIDQTHFKIINLGLIHYIRSILKVTRKWKHGRVNNSKKLWCKWSNHKIYHKIVKHVQTFLWNLVMFFKIKLWGLCSPIFPHQVSRFCQIKNKIQ